MKKNKKWLIIIISAIIIIGVIVTVLLTTGNNNSQEKELTVKMEEMGKDFYENFYYDKIGSTDEERATFLAKYETLGIKIDLDNLSRYANADSDEVIKEFVNEKTKEECDKTNTRVIIYPKRPYSKDSYDLVVELECGFNEE